MGAIKVKEEQKETSGISKKDVIAYKDLEYVTKKGADRAKKITGVELSANDILTIFRIGVLEYGSQCVQNDNDFRLRRFGCFKVKDCSTLDKNLTDFLNDKTAKRKERIVQNKKNKVEGKKSKKDFVPTLDISFDSSIFVSLNNFNDKITIINDNGNWNGNFGKCESRPPVRQVGDVLYQDNE